MPETVKVRVAVVVDDNGEWNSFGCSRSGWSDTDCDKENMATALEFFETGEAEALYFLEAELKLPDLNTVKAKVERA